MRQLLCVESSLNCGGAETKTKTAMIKAYPQIIWSQGDGLWVYVVQYVRV